MVYSNLQDSSKRPSFNLGFGPFQSTERSFYRIIVYPLKTVFEFISPLYGTYSYLFDSRMLKLIVHEGRTMDTNDVPLSDSFANVRRHSVRLSGPAYTSDHHSFTLRPSVRLGHR